MAQRLRQHPRHRARRLGRLGAQHVEHRHVERLEGLRRRRLAEQCTGPALDVGDRHRDRGPPVVGHQAPAARPHPVVDESLRCRLRLVRGERAGRVVHRAADAAGRSPSVRLVAEHRKECRLVEREGTGSFRVGERCDQCNRSAVRMADQKVRRAGRREHRLEQRHLVTQRHGTIRRRRLTRRPLFGRLAARQARPATAAPASPLRQR